MKKKVNLIPLFLIIGLLFFGFNKAKAQDADVHIYLPYSGNFNYWTITFSNYANTYTFYTDNSTFSSQYLGTLPEGRYDVSFDSNYFSWYGFDFGVSTPTSTSWRVSHQSFTWYNVDVAPDVYLSIDEGY